MVIWKTLRDVREPSRRFHDESPTGPNGGHRAELLPVAAGQVPDVPGAEQRRTSLDAPDRQHQFRRERGVVGEAAASPAAAQRSHVADGLQRDRIGAGAEQQPRRSAASPSEESLGPRRMERTLVGALLGVGLAVGSRQGTLVRPRP